MLTQEQKDLGTSIAVLAGTTIKIAPGTAEAGEYLKYIADEIEKVANQETSGNPVKDETEAVLGVLENIGVNIPDTSKGKKKFIAAVKFMSAAAHMLGL